MKQIFGAAILLVLSQTNSFALDADLKPEFVFPGWVTSQHASGSTFLNCVDPKKCMEGSVVSMHVHHARPQTNEQILQRYGHVTINCGKIEQWSYCDYGQNVDQSGRPIPGIRDLPADFPKPDGYYYTGYLFNENNGTPVLVTLVSSAKRYNIAVKNYKMLWTQLVAPKTTAKP